MLNPEYKDGDPVPGDVDWVKPEVLSEEEFLERWRQARATQPSPVEQVEEMRRGLPIHSFHPRRRGHILLRGATGLRE